jgi:hypothetical protein
MTIPISKLHSIALIGLISLASCAKDAVDDLSKDYFPLQVGNYWEFSPYWTDSIDKIEKLDGNDYYRMVSADCKTRSYLDTVYYRKTADGKVYKRSKRTTGDILKFDLAAQVGQTWNYILPGPYQSLPWNATLKSNTDIIPLGNDTIINCYRYFFDIPQMADEEECWLLAPGIGFVVKNNYNGWLGGYKLKKVRINGIVREF